MVLDTVLQEKYLSVLLSNNMSWSNHIHTIATKANQKLGFLRRNLKESPLDCKKLAYVALVHSALEYASIIWDPYLQDVDSLERVQRKATRWVTSTYDRKPSVSCLMRGYRPPIPGVRHSHGPGFGVRVRDRVRDRVRVRRTVGMADPGNGGPEPMRELAYNGKHCRSVAEFNVRHLCTRFSMVRWQCQPN